jgi:hypothetical protein
MFSNSSGEHHTLNDWLRLFRKADPFGEEVFNFVQGPISFLDEDGNTIHINITAIEHIPHWFAEELRLQFSVSDKPLEAEELQQMGKFRGGQKMRISLRPNETYTYSPLLWYTFSSQLSLNENIRNLHEFVLSHHRQAATRPQIQPERLSQ